MLKALVSNRFWSIKVDNSVEYVNKSPGELNRIGDGPKKLGMKPPHFDVTNVSSHFSCG